MRLVLSLTTLAVLTPFAFAKSTEETKEADRLEKAGARVTYDDGMPDTARLRVHFVKLDDKAAVALKGCTHVATLAVDDASKLTDRILTAIGTFAGLRELSLVRASITGAGLAHLKDLKELRKLYLIDARLYDAGVAQLKGLDTLEELDVSGTGITNAAGATFKTLTGLKLLAVTKTKFGDSGVAHLKELKDLKTLEAVNTDVSVKAAMALEAALPGIRVKR